MKNVAQMGVLVAAIVAGTGFANANEPGGDMGRYGPRIQFEKVDANNDGQLTKDEMAAHMKAHFNQMDVNDDGLVSEDEMRSGMRAMSEARIERRVTHMMERHDANGDKLLSEDEMKPKRMSRMFDRADADGDGQISREEFDAMKDKRRKCRGSNKG